MKQEKEYHIKANWKLTKLDFHIMGKFLGTFLFGLALFIIIIVIFDVTEKLDYLLKIPFGEVIENYYINFCLFYVSLLSPLVIFLAVIFFTAKMAYNTEIVPILSSGTSYFRFLYPYFTLGAILSLVAFWLNGYLIPPAARDKLDFERKYFNKNYEFKGQNKHYQLDSSTFAYLQTYTVKKNIGTRFTLEKFNKDTLTYKLVAPQIIWDQEKESWRLENYTIRYNEGLKERMEAGRNMYLKINLYPEDFHRQDKTQGTLTLTQLSEQIELEKMRGTGNIAYYEMEWWRIVTTPVSIFILVIIAVTLSSRKVRGGIGLQLGIGIACSFGYIILMQFAVIFSTKGGVPTYIAAWIPHLIFGYLAYNFYNKAPK